jgi:Zn-finger nucleic acid-binding protein
MVSTHLPPAVSLLSLYSSTILKACSIQIELSDSSCQTIIPRPMQDSISETVLHWPGGEIRRGDSVMQCPKCHAAAADFHTSEGVTVNFCRGCSGLWFEKGELALYCETDSDLPHLEQLLPQAQTTAYACPHCASTRLVELPYMAGADLQVDWCPHCQGAWLDARELPKVERLATQFDSHTARLRRTVDELQRAGYNIVGWRV